MRWIAGISVSLALGAGAALAWAAEPLPEGKPVPPASVPVATGETAKFFETRVRPVLAQHCFACHGEKAQKGGLRLDTAAGFFKGGDTGSLVTPGDPEKSLLLHAVRYDGPVKMPPHGKLSPRQIEDLAAWVKLGAPWPEYGGRGSGVRGQGGKGKLTIDNSQLSIVNSGTARNWWSFQPVKAPAIPRVKNAAAVRNPIDAFVQAKLAVKGLKPSPEASKRELIRRATFELIGLPPTPDEVDAFLADQSPEAYEKLIDRLLARPQYGERWGRHWLDVVRFAQTNGYERDAEKPFAWRYRDYVIQSFNEDKPYDQFVREQIAGDELDTVTDASLVATAFYRLGVWDDEPDDARQAEFDNLDDMLSTLGSAFMGLTVGCARCHDHKFDPISQAEYYSLLTFLRNIKRYVKHDDKSADQVIFAPLKGGEKTLAVVENGAVPPKTHVLIRGSAATPAAEVQPGFIRVLCGSEAATQPVIPAAQPGAKTSGRRRVLAEWLASPHHPLTARVMANRLWHYHFGRGLVATPNDFGRTGLAPTHPELLDYLASELVEGGWKLKRMHRLIMLSATYRQASRAENPKAVAVDPGNRLLWRQNLRRLEAEAIRDAILATSGKLNLAMGGRGVFPALPPEVLATQSAPGSGWGKSDEAERSRRSVYIFIKRTLGVPLLETFDLATPDNSIAARATTTVAPQALILLNSTFADEQAAAFAQRLEKEAGAGTDARIERAFRLALARRPTPRELEIARSYIDRHTLAAFCKVVLNLNEFVYID